MNMRHLFSGLCHSPMPRRSAVTLVALVALAWGSLAFCGEIHDAARSGDLAKVRALLKSNPSLVFSKDKSGGPPPGKTGTVIFFDYPKGRTALHFAAENGHKNVAELLLVYKAEVDAK